MGAANGSEAFNAARPQDAAVSVEADESPSIAQLAAALAKAQGQMRGAAKDKLNPHFKTRYADLASVWDACREALSSNGLAVLQRVATVEEGVLLTTMLVHASGEWVRDRMTLPVTQQTAQGIGSAITYARRYALSSLVGVAADEDDDGNAASARVERHSAPPPHPPSPPPPPVPVEDPAALALRARKLRMWKQAQAQNISLEDFQGIAKSALGGTEKPSAEWTADDTDHVEEALRAELELRKAGG